MFRSSPLLHLLRTILLAIAILILSSCAKPDNGFTPLFNGQDLQGWKGATENYTIMGGAIQCKANQKGTLFTKKVYSDFVLKLEFKLPPGGNNGLAIRYPGHGDPAYSGMCELQILDNSAAKYADLDDRQYHGSAYGIVAAKRGHLKATGEWNSQIVTVTGHHIKVELNGTTILDSDVSHVSEYLDDKEHPGKLLKKGHLGFAGHNDPVSFRNIYIKEI